MQVFLKQFLFKYDSDNKDRQSSTSRFPSQTLERLYGRDNIFIGFL